MFWDTFADDASSLTGVSSVLSRESFSLADILREDDVLSEFGASNVLVSFVVKNVREVIKLALTSPKTEEEARFAFFSTEMLRFGHAPVSDALVANSALLLGFLDSIQDGALHITPAENFARIVIKMLETNKLQPQQLPVSALLRHLYNGSVLNVVNSLVFACTSEFETVRGARLVRQLDGGKAAWLSEQHVPNALCKSLFDDRLEMREHGLEALEKLVGFAQADDAVSKQLADSVSLFKGDGHVIEASQGAEILIARYPTLSSALNSFVVAVCTSSLKEGSSLRVQIVAARLLRAQSSSPVFPNASLLPEFVSLMLRREKATLLALAVTDCINTALANHFEVRSQMQQTVIPLLVQAFVKEPRQLMGLLIAVLHQNIDLVEDETVRKSVEDHILRQKTPLFGVRDPDRYIAKLDLKGGDIDGIKM